MGIPDLLRSPEALLRVQKNIQCLRDCLVKCLFQSPGVARQAVIEQVALLCGLTHFLEEA